MIYIIFEVIVLRSDHAAHKASGERPNQTGDEGGGSLLSRDKEISLTREGYKGVLGTIFYSSLSLFRISFVNDSSDRSDCFLILFHF